MVWVGVYNSWEWVGGVYTSWGELHLFGGGVDTYLGVYTFLVGVLHLSVGVYTSVGRGGLHLFGGVYTSMGGGLHLFIYMHR